MRTSRVLTTALLVTSHAAIASCFVVSTAVAGSRSTIPAVGQGYLTTLSSAASCSRPRAKTAYASQREGSHRLDAKKGKGGAAGRPSLDDVERLSKGLAAKKRGTGSRAVCHRLNESERKVGLISLHDMYQDLQQATVKSMPKYFHVVHSSEFRRC